MQSIVIGSGPAGVSTARALLAAGRDVLMLDAGEQMEPAAAGLRARLGGVEPADWTRADLDAVLGPSRGEQSDLMRPFGSDFHFRDPVDFFGLAGPPADVDLRPSFATGGLSNGWGASVLPYRTEDMHDWPVDAEDLAPHYRAVRDFVPIAARRDDLTTLFPALPIGEDSSLPSSSQATRLLERLEARRDALRRQGIHFGKARVAVAAASCRRCRMCLQGCPYGLIYNAAATLDDLCRDGRLTYRRDQLVTHFEEIAGGVRVRSRRLSDGSEHEAVGERLFVAAGVLPTARLVLGALDRYDETVRLKDSLHFYLPLLHSWTPRPDPADERLHTLTQAFLELVDPAVDRHTVHVQLYSHNDFYAADMRRRFGSLAPLAGPLIGRLSRRLIVAQSFLHSDASPELQVALVRSKRGDRIRLERGLSRDVAPTIARVRDRLSSALRASGLVALTPLVRVGEPGSSFHCGGSFPMRERPAGLESDRLGRPAGLERVHLVDASVFPSIPATTITLSVMANAHRIASEAAALTP